MFYQLHSTETLPNVQCGTGSTLFHSHAAIGSQKKRPAPLSAFPAQSAAESREVPSVSSSTAWTAKCPQLLPTRRLQPRYQIWCIPLDAFKDLNI